MGCGGSKEKKEEANGFPHEAMIFFDQMKVNNMMQWYIVDNEPTSAATTVAVNRAVAFFTRQSLERDGLSPNDFSVKVFETNDPGAMCNIQITGSSESIKEYQAVFSTFWDISYVAYEQYTQLCKEAAAQQPPLDTSAITFSPELGLPMTTPTSIALLYFPPNSTKYYSDYQYAQTVTAWWANMAHNGCSNAEMIQMARIVDITALVATSTAAKDPAFKFLAAGGWDAYVHQQLSFYIGMNPASGAQTIPVIVMGSEPKAWLYKTNKAQIDEQLNPDGKDPKYDGPVNNDVVVLTGLVSGKPDLKTPVMFSVHPSAILFDTNKPFLECLNSEGTYPSPFETCMQGQIAAGWNVKMAQNPQADPLATKAEVEKMWAVTPEEMTNGIYDPAECSENKKRVFQALIEKYVEFGYNMEELDKDIAQRANYVTGTADVDNWVDDRIPVETDKSYLALQDSRFVANQMIVASNEPGAFAQFVTPDTTQKKKQQIKIVTPRPWLPTSSKLIADITAQWNKDQLALHPWDSQDIQGSVLSGGWVLPSSNPTKELSLKSEENREE